MALPTNKIKKINNIETKIFHGYLTYTPETCPKCGHDLSNGLTG